MVALQRIVDRYAGFVIVSFLALLKKLEKKHETTPKKILVIKLWAIGDSVLTLALIQGIKKCYGCKVDVLTTGRVENIFANPLVEKILFPKDAINNLRKYDLVFDCEPYLNLSAILSFLLGKTRVGFSGQPRSAVYNETVRFRKDQHMVQNYLDMLRKVGKEYDTDKLVALSYPKSCEKKINRILPKKKFIGITPGVAESAKSRMWYEERFAALADRIKKELKADVVFFDSSANKPVVEKILSLMKEPAVDLSGRLSLDETICGISRASIFISNDTGPMHISAAMGVKTISLFGPNTPVLWGPYGKGNVSIYKTLLAPSIDNAKGVFPEYGREEFMGPIRVEDVYKAVEKTWKDLK